MTNNNNIPKIAWDAGHGIHTLGKQTPDGIKEYELNDKVRDKATAYLSEYEVEIINTDNDEGEKDESLSSRRTMYVNAGVKAAVSFHHNALGSVWNDKVTGVEVYVDKNATAADLLLARLIYERLVKYTGLRGRGIKYANFTVINQNTVPAVLVEGGFMDSTIDYPVITSEAGQDAYARAVAEGVIEFCNLKKKAGWIQDDIGWWYRDADGTYPVSQWLELDAWYYFDTRGYALCNTWQKINGEWYYFDENCRMVTGWKELVWNGVKSWYYFDTEDGDMIYSKWILYNGCYYYLDKSGIMATNCYIKAASKNIYYWVNVDGVWEPQWDTATPNLTKYRLVE